ncbi:MAG: sensor histidine kinase [Ignavibacteriales bacterium]|nr:sensor histidine kinase [Ignavibacteriales bacterium]
MKTRNTISQIFSKQPDPVEEVINMVTQGEFRGRSQEWKERGLRVLIVEDIEADAELMELELKRARIPFVSNRVSTKDDFMLALESFKPDLVLADYLLPKFSALEVLELLKERRPTVPCILITGTQSEEIAVECIKHGAQDYILKQSLMRLPNSILQTLEKKSAEERKLGAEEALRQSEKELRALAGHLQSVREEERGRISREIHDELGQTLTALKMDLMWLEGKLRDLKQSALEPLFPTILSMTQLIDSLIQTIRRIASELRPRVLDDLGLISAIEWQTHEFRTRMGIECKFTSTTEYVKLDNDLAAAVFRILQESLTNVARHAQATRVQIHLDTNNRALNLRIEDNGVGIADRGLIAIKSLGLVGMRERAMMFGGTVHIQGASGGGTSVFVQIPLVLPSPDESP